MVHRLPRAYSLIAVVDEKLADEISTLLAHMWNQLVNTCPFLSSKVEVHMRRLLLKFSQDLSRWRPHNVVDFIHLIEFIVAWE